MEMYCTRNPYALPKGHTSRKHSRTSNTPHTCLFPAINIHLSLHNSQTMEIQALSPETIQDTVPTPPDSIPADQIDSTFSTCIGNAHPQPRPLHPLYQFDQSYSPRPHRSHICSATLPHHRLHRRVLRLNLQPHDPHPPNPPPRLFHRNRCLLPPPISFRRSKNEYLNATRRLVRWLGNTAA